MPPSPASVRADTMVDDFFESLRGLHAQPHLCRNEEETGGTLKSILAGFDCGFVVLGGLPPEVGRVVESAIGGTKHVNAEELRGAESAPTIARADVGITWAEAGVANQGALLEVAYDETVKLASSLPFNHIALLSSKKLYRDLSEAMPAVGGILRSGAPDRFPTISFISGPSKTGDIEMKLLYGVHGPHTLTVLALDWL